MPFYARVSGAIAASQNALNQLRNYNPYAHPRSEPNNSIRNHARLTLDPAYYSVREGLREGYYERVRPSNLRQAEHASDLLRRATFDLSDKQGRPTNVPVAQRHISEAIHLLQRARY